jgi:hypothetical protein
VKATAFWLFACLAAAPALAATQQSLPDVQSFILGLQEDLHSQRYESYLQAYAPELRQAQRESLELFFNRLRMDTVNLYLTNKGAVSSPEQAVFVQAFYQNSYSALVETWQLTLAAEAGVWKIKAKTVHGNVSQLYKIKIPADRVEKVESVQIEHTDIRITFKDALIYYDNIPGLDTAALIIGRGAVVFSPSDPNESHQLVLMYKSPRLQDSISYAYVRCSPSFFERHITLRKNPAFSTYAPTPAEKSLADSLFRKLSPRFFTVQTPLSPEPLSFLPLGDEAVFEFLGRKTGEMSYAYSAFADEEVILYNRTQNRFVNLYSPSFDKDKRRLVITLGEKFDVQGYDLELAFDPDELRLSARARISLLARVDGLDAVKLKFNPALEILHIFDAERRELFFSQDAAGRLIYVYLLEPVPAGRTAVIDVFYRGRLEPPAQFQDALAAGQQSDTVISVAPRYETYFYSQSADWYPAPSEDDFFTARLKIIVPPGYTAIASGRLLETGTLNGIQRVTELDKVGSVYAIFDMATPVKYLSFLVGKLSLTEEQTEAPPISTYVASDVRWLRRNFLDDAKKILSFYEERFGPYPFGNLRIIQRLWSTAGGHSPASFLVVNELPRRSDATGAIVPMIPSPNSPVDLSQWKDYFLAHEIAHQWWGQGVSGSSYRDQWLSEGMAQFAALLYLRSRYREAAFAGILKKFSKWTGKKSAWGPITLGSRLSHVDFEAYQAIIYDKAALVLNMLRDMLGDETFFSGLKDFFSRHLRGTASTGQFRVAMEKACGRDLGDFFEPWFYSYELPDARVSRSVARDSSGFVLRLRVEQPGPLFVFPLWVSWKDAAGESHREKVVVERRSQEFELRSAGEFRKVTLNPDKAVPGRIAVAKS